jgi:molybdopterin molybdotransferase
LKSLDQLISFADAQAMIENNIRPITRTELVRIDDVLGRVLAQDFVTSLNVPSYIRSSRDGFAVRSGDISGCSRTDPKVLEIVGRVFAGDIPRLTLKSGQCVQIATGAMPPRGADSVVMVEDTESDDTQVKIFHPSQPGDNIGAVGEDVKENTVAIKAGTVINAGMIGILASQGKTRIEVFARPRVSILPSGNEVLPLGKRLRRGQLYNTNAYTIAAVIQDNGGDPYPFQIVNDRADVVRGTIAEAIKDDMVVISGGSSVGERDLIAAVIEGWGKVLFHGIRVRPGKPALFAVVEDKPVFGLPGYPAASLMSAYLLVLPALRKMARLPSSFGKTLTVPMGHKVQVKSGLRQFYTVNIKNGEAILTPKDTAAITGIATADGYIELLEDIDHIEKGDPVNVTLF